jgi:CTP:molybdopterin cytidylyltransferase MocA
MKHGGVVTAAGASSRMGSPKALLAYPDGRRLAAVQADTFRQAGCDDVVIVLGKDAERIAAELSGCRTVINPDWSKGRLTSICAGLRALSDCDGYLIMPVDAVGVRVETCEQLLSHSEGKTALRATFKGKPGHLLWISRHVVDQLLSARLDPDTPLNIWLKPLEELVEVDDAAICRNMNTPIDWQAFVADRDRVADESL